MSKLLVFHDGWCTLCQKSARQAERLDWFHQLEFRSFRDLEPGAYGFDVHAMEQRIHSVDLKSGRVYQGIETILAAAKRLPLGLFAVPFLYLSIWLGLGERLYDWIARRRNIVPVGQCQLHGCSLDMKPPRQETQEER